MGKVIKFYREYGEHGKFSNFHKHRKPLKYKEKYYATGEHLYQALKYRYKGAPAANAEMAEAIRTQGTPNKAFLLARGYGGCAKYAWGKALIDLHRKIGATLHPKWETKKIKKMHIVVQLKADQDPEFAAELKATGDAELVENSPYDTFWGCGKDGKGKNHLGKILMEVRKNLIQDSSSDVMTS